MHGGWDLDADERTSLLILMSDEGGLSQRRLRFISSRRSDLAICCLCSISNLQFLAWDMQ